MLQVMTWIHIESLTASVVLNTDIDRRKCFVDYAIADVSGIRYHFIITNKLLCDEKDPFIRSSRFLMNL